MIKRLTIVACTAVALAGCSSPPAAIDTGTPSPTSSAPVESRSPSAVMPSPTTTPSQTAVTPPPTTAAEVVKALRQAGLPIRLTVTFTAKTDPNHLLGRPNGYDSKAAFSDKRVSASDVGGVDKGEVKRGGGVEVYSTEAGAMARGKYIRSVGQSFQILGSEYGFVSGGVLLRVSGNLTPKVAREYRRTLAQVMGGPARVPKV